MIMCSRIWDQNEHAIDSMSGDTKGGEYRAAMCVRAMGNEKGDHQSDMETRGLGLKIDKFARRAFAERSLRRSCSAPNKEK